MIGIFGGSFNPVHLGHTALAEYIRDCGSLEAVWLVLSPLNPLKSKPEELIDDGQRLEMLKLACADLCNIEPCDIELSMPRPSYTVNTLRALRSLYPDKQFRLIIGEDNWNTFNNWRCPQEIINDYGVIVYPRSGSAASSPEEESSNCLFLQDAPKYDVSSTEIRESLRNGKLEGLANYLNPRVLDYILKNHLYGS